MADFNNCFKMKDCADLQSIIPAFKKLRPIKKKNNCKSRSKKREWMSTKEKFVYMLVWPSFYSLSLQCHDFIFKRISLWTLEKFWKKCNWINEIVHFYWTSFVLEAKTVFFNSHFWQSMFNRNWTQDHLVTRLLCYRLNKNISWKLFRVVFSLLLHINVRLTGGAARIFLWFLSFASPVTSRKTH